VITRAEWSGGYGNLIEIHHGNGIVTRYGHLQAFAPGVATAERVAQGEVIGYVGSTGLATGAHLHYEFRVNGESRNPGAIHGKGEPLTPDERLEFDRERSRLAALLTGTTPAYASGAERLPAENTPAAGSTD
jgi:murein DD-endopeptidase MepM/ murein hydrolase activator NlpD